MDPTLLALLAAGGVYVATRDAGGGIAEPIVPAGGTTPTTPTSPTTGTFDVRKTRAGAILYSGQTSYVVARSPSDYSGGSPTVTQVALSSPILTAGATTGPNEYAAEIEKYLKDRMQAEFDSMTGEARAAACAKMKEQFPNDASIQAIDCDKADLAAVIEAVIVAGTYAVATAYCGPVCGALAAIIVSYFAGDIAEWVQGAWDDFKNAFDPEDRTSPTMPASVYCYLYPREDTICKGSVPR